MNAPSPETLARHVGHEGVIVSRGGGENLAIECVTCTYEDFADAYRPGMNGPDGGEYDRLYDAYVRHVAHAVTISGEGGRTEIRCVACDESLWPTTPKPPEPVLRLDRGGVTTEAFNFPEGTFADLSAERGLFYVLLMEDGDSAKNSWALAGPVETLGEARALVEPAVDRAYNLIDKNLTCYHAFVGRVENMPELVGEFNEDLGVGATERQA